MNQRKMRRTEEQYNFPDLRGKIVDVIESLKNYLTTLPEESRVTAEIEFSDCDYDIYYELPETDMQMEHRIKREEREEARRIESFRQHEQLAQLEEDKLLAKLKLKYPEKFK